MSETGEWTSGAVAALGAWVAVAALVLFEATNPVNFWNDVIVGGAILVIGAYNYLAADEEHSVSVVAGSFVVLLGVWLIVGALNFYDGTPLAFWSDVAAGALVALLAGYDVYQGRFFTVEEEAEEAEHG